MNSKTELKYLSERREQRAKAILLFKKLKNRYETQEVSQEIELIIETPKKYLHY